MHQLLHDQKGAGCHSDGKILKELGHVDSGASIVNDDVLSLPDKGSGLFGYRGLLRCKLFDGIGDMAPLVLLFGQYGSSICAYKQAPILKLVKVGADGHLGYFQIPGKVYDLYCLVLE